MRRVIAAVIVLIAAACGGSTPPSPSPALNVAVPALIAARMVTCGTCREPPFSWEAADFNVDVSDPAGRGGTVASVEAVVRNVTRGADLGSNRIPNASVGLTNASVPAAGALTVDMGVTFDVPAPGDEVQITVTVTLADGRSASATSRIAPGQVLGRLDEHHVSCPLLASAIYSIVQPSIAEVAELADAPA